MLPFILVFSKWKKHRSIGYYIGNAAKSHQERFFSVNIIWGENGELAKNTIVETAKRVIPFVRLKCYIIDI